MTESQTVPERVQKNADHTLLQARLLTGGNYLNPKNISLPFPSKDDLGKQDSLDKTMSLLQTRSDTERNTYWQNKAIENVSLSTFDAQYTNWKDDMISFVQNKQNKPILDELKRIGVFAGLDAGSDIDAFYQRYFGNGVESATSLFISDMLKAYDYDVQSIQSNESTIVWIASVFGGNSKMIITQLTEALSKTHSEKGKIQLADEAKEKWQSQLPAEDMRLLEWLYGSSEPTEIEKTDESEQNSADIPPEETTYRETPVSIEDMFSGLKKPIDKKNQKLMNEWFVNDVPDELTLTPTQITDILLKPEPFLDRNGMTNKKQNPQVWDFMNEGANQTDPRFYEAAWTLTNDDSSMLALSAIAAETPKDQARLYRAVSGALVQVNELNPRLILEYMMAQDPGSLGMFIADDTKRNQSGETIDYMLVPGAENGNVNESLFIQVWADRLKELRQAVDRNEFTLYHHRWIEALSRTVDIKKLYSILRSNN